MPQWLYTKTTGTMERIGVSPQGCQLWSASGRLHDVSIQYELFPVQAILIE